MFAVDASSDLKEDQFKKIKEFISTVSYSFVVSKSSSHVGVVTYGHGAAPDIAFTTGSDMERLSAAISNLAAQRRGDKLHTGLRVARKLLFGSKGR